jgi:tetratricopeptide (TPR) repeat protein
MILAFALPSAGALCLAQATTSGGIEEFYQRARQAQERGDYAHAAREWEAIVQRAEGLAEAHSNLGMMYHLNGEYGAAIQAFRRALQLNSKLLAPSLFLGIDYYLTSRTEDAIEQLRRALALDPRNGVARKWLGMSYAHAGDFPTAAEHLRLGRIEDPNDIDLLFHLGRVYSRICYRSYESLRLLASESAWQHLLAGEKHLDQGHFERARAEFHLVLADPRWQEAVRLTMAGANPESVVSAMPRIQQGAASGDRPGRARQLLMKGDTVTALELFATLQKADPDNAEYLYFVGRCAEKLALEILQQFLRIAPDSYRAHQLKAEYRLAQNNHGEAIAEYRRALSLKSNAIQIHLALGAIYENQGDYETALAEYHDELKADPFSALAMERVGTIYVRLHQASEAKKYLLQAVRISPNSAETHKALGKAYLQDGLYAEAVRHFELALQKAATTDPSVYFQLSKALRRTGKVEAAEQNSIIFRRALAERLQRLQSGTDKLVLSDTQP